MMREIRRTIRLTEHLVIAAAITFVGVIAPVAMRAQGSAVDVSDAPRLWKWTPLSPIADLGMPAPRQPGFPRLLDLPVPPLGVASISSNPARLPDEIDSAWTQLVLSSNGTGGSYHRPLDPGSVSSLSASLAGWRRIGTRGAAIGRVAIERDNVGDGSYSAFAVPYGSSPFVPADTNRPAFGRTTVILEGGEGIALGEWLLGAALGYRGQADNSSHSTASEVGRASSSGLSLGAAREIGSGTHLGLFGRGLQSTETVDLIANPQIVRVYGLDGYTNPDPADFIPSLPPFVRRSDRTATAWGADIDGHGRGTSWLVHAESQSSQERQLSDVLAENPPTDRWRASGYAVGGSVQRALRGWLATIDADWSAQHGDAARAEVTAGSYRADASRLALAADVRYTNETTPWSAAATLSIGREQQRATDNAAAITTDITAWLPSAAVEVARRMDDGLTISLGYGRSQFTPFAGVPSPDNRGAAYSLFVAPAIEVAAATAYADQWSASVRWRNAAGAFAFRAWTSTLQPTARPDPTVPLPRGDRSSWGLAMSIEPGRR